MVTENSGARGLRIQVGPRPGTGLHPVPGSNKSNAKKIKQCWPFLRRPILVRREWAHRREKVDGWRASRPDTPRVTLVGRNWIEPKDFPVGLWDGQKSASGVDGAPWGNLVVEKVEYRTED